ncbi:RNA 2',3'-cyclic phosphodiesterase [Variovorax sp. RKNM96]|uniref:2'-5' RNA ligase family protein n=1 Tax=Variovorax sp. RKNM96 TaxID=2681552 RepID=UPI001980D560|nr:2'-5' RNA ligase family protein [Variovorax sp. RKNM96]QSI30387.1 RNA 2',3'-cyclic phosphodiesterase [Variovorax sp. RKNM96]
MDDFNFGNDFPDEPEPDWDSPFFERKQHLLIALFPERDVQAAIEKHREDWLWPKGHYFPPSPRMHLTLHCFADQNSAVEKRLREELARVPMQVMNLVLNSSRTWRKIAVAQSAEHKDLRALHANIGRAMQKAGIATRRSSFTPHITIARQAEGAAYPMSLPPIPWRVRKFLLVRSFTSHPVEHQVLATYEADEEDDV